MGVYANINGVYVFMCGAVRSDGNAYGKPGTLVNVNQKRQLNIMIITRQNLKLQKTDKQLFKLICNL